jgi:hypothetical protein
MQNTIPSPAIEETTMLYGGNQFIPGWSLDDLADIGQTFRGDGKSYAEISPKVVVDLFKALDEAGVTLPETLDGNGKLWTTDTVRQIYQGEYLADKPLVSIHVDLLDGLLETVSTQCEQTRSFGR